MKRLMSWCRLHIELTLVLPMIVAGIAGAWYATWRRGLPLIEVGPILVDYLVGLLAVAGIGYLAWAFKREYWYDLTGEAEAELHAKAAAGDKGARWVIVKDRVEFVVLLLLLVFGFSRFAGAQESAAADLITKWEVSGTQGYVRCCERPIWPGGESGITWAIGYDGGHQHPDTIAREWRMHPCVARLATTAGITGLDAKAALPRYRDIITPYAMARRVLIEHSLPRYSVMARRAYGRAYDAAPQAVRDALLDETYNRGTGMAGDRRRERRVIRDQCLPAGDWACVAEQLAASCRVWAGQPIGVGLCNRRLDEAALARTFQPHVTEINHGTSR
jgi:hypothetical protein